MLPLLILAAHGTLACAPAPIERAAQARDEAYNAGVAQRIAGDNAAAAATFAALIAANADDHDARLQLALALTALGRHEEARAHLRGVLAAAPGYDDAALALARVEIARQDRASARASLAPVLARRPDDAEARALQAQIEAIAAPAPWRLDIAATHARLSTSAPDWRALSVSLSRRIGASSAATARVETIERFGIGETYVEAEYGRGWRSGEWYVALGASLEPLFKPEHALRLGVLAHAKQGSPWRLGADLNLASYAVGNVKTLRLGADRFVSGDRGLIGARWIYTRDETDRAVSGYSLNASWRLVERLDVSGSYTDAPEFSDGASVDVRAAGVGLGYEVSVKTSVRADFVHELRASGGERDEIAVSATYRF